MRCDVINQTGRTLLIDSGARTTPTYDAANEQLVDFAAAGRSTYLYDLAGNRSQQQQPAATTFYTWDRPPCASF